MVRFDRFQALPADTDGPAKCSGRLQGKPAPEPGKAEKRPQGRFSSRCSDSRAEPSSERRRRSEATHAFAAQLLKDAGGRGGDVAREEPRETPFGRKPEQIDGGEHRFDGV